MFLNGPDIVSLRSIAYSSAPGGAVQLRVIVVFVVADTLSVGGLTNTGVTLCTGDGAPITMTISAITNAPTTQRRWRRITDENSDGNTDIFMMASGKATASET